MWPARRNRKSEKIENLQETVAYDTISKGKTENLVILYDEATVLLFEKPLNKKSVKKI